jgi:polyisoprenoid-binding protein YceI
MKNYKIDPMHSEIGFKVKHLMISNVYGNFKSFDATMESSSEDFTDAKITFDADVDSISTNISDRDAHLKTEDFFNVSQYPKVSFVSTNITKTSDSDYVITGEITIRDTTKTVILNGVYNGSDIDPYGQIKHGFELSGKISRNDFGLMFNVLSGKGNALVGDEIKLLLNVQMIEI